MTDASFAEYEQSQADEHFLREWAFHTEDGTYWAWVEQIAKEIAD